MTDNAFFYLKLFLFTEALTHALRSWVILAPLRDHIRSHFVFMDRLLECFECSAVWGCAISLVYICFVDFWPVTAIIILSRWANVLHIVIDWIDALRACTTNKI